MKDRKQWIRRLTEKAELYGEALPSVPLIEVAWDNRVLIENHCGVAAYGPKQITVRVNSGEIRVCGQELRLSVMSRGMLVISGRIEGVFLRGKGTTQC